MRELERPSEKELAALRVNPNPRLVWFINFALTEVMGKLRYNQADYREWFSWAQSWLNAEYSPERCVEVSHHCSDREEKLVWHSLGQLAWGAKEACYSHPKSGWLVIRYIADAMDAFGVAFPERALPLLPDSAQAGEAFGRDAKRLDAKHEHAVPEGDAP